MNETLPDLLQEALDVVFVGINPSLFSVAQGHYFARKTNRFWPCFSRSELSIRPRMMLGLARLEPAHDQLLPACGIGFTDVVKRATANARTLGREELVLGAAALADKLERWNPRIACFHGMTGYRPFAAALGDDATKATLGAQGLRLGPIHLFVVPNPSPANAHFTPVDQTAWYDRLAKYLHITSRPEAPPCVRPRMGETACRHNR